MGKRDLNLYRRARRRGRQVSRDHDTRKPALFMCGVAKRFVGGLPTAAKRYARATAQSENLSLRIHNLKIAFYSDGSIVAYGDFGHRHF